jgi:hypothetical protein
MDPDARQGGRIRARIPVRSRDRNVDVVMVVPRDVPILRRAV